MTSVLGIRSWTRALLGEHAVVNVELTGSKLRWTVSG